MLKLNQKELYVAPEIQELHFECSEVLLSSGAYVKNSNSESYPDDWAQGNVNWF